MTWLDLAYKILNEFSNEQVHSDITVFDPRHEEFFPAKLEFSELRSDDGIVQGNIGVLDDGHPFLMPKD